MWPFDKKEGMKDGGIVPVTKNEFKYLENQVLALKNIDSFTESEKLGHCVFLRERQDVRFQLGKDQYGLSLFISSPKDIWIELLH